MALQATVDFRLKTAADPANISTVAGWAVGTGSQAAAYVNRGEIGWEAKVVQSLWYYATAMQGNVIECEVTAGVQIATSIGAAIIDASGNGYMVINNNTASSLRIFLVVASQLSGSALVTVNFPMVVGQRIMLRRTITPSNTYEILIDGVSLGSYNAPGTYDPTYGACVSRFGSIRQVDLYYTPNQTVTSINGGSPFTATQTTSSAVTTGFTGLPTTITATWAGGSIPITGIGGSTNAPTFTKAVRVDGSQYPKSGEVLTLTFTKSSETANGNQTFNKDSDEVELAVTAPIINDPKYLFGAIYATTGRTNVTGDYGYYKVPIGMSDLTIDTDGRIQTTNAGTFQIWIYTAATAINYYYNVTVAAGGAVVYVGGLTSAGLTSSGLTSPGLTSSGL